MLGFRIGGKCRGRQGGKACGQSRAAKNNILTQKQMVSMQRMQKLQPRIKVLQNKYGDDKETLNREMMALYKEEKISPAAGCLPLLIQIPIFILLYRVLYNNDFAGATFLTVHLDGSVLTTVADALKYK